MGYLKTGRPTSFIISLTSHVSRRIFLTSCFLLLTSCFLLLSSSLSPAHAAIQWSASAVAGYYSPRLDELNYILKNAFVELGPRNTEAKPFSYPVIYQGISPEMPKMRPDAPKMGLQIQADLNPRYAMVFGMSTANLASTKKDIRNFFVGFNIPAVRETRFSLLLNQFWFGAKRYWIWGESGDISKTAEARSQKEEGGREGKQSQETLLSIKEKSR